VPTEAGKRSYFSTGTSFEKLQQFSQVWTKLNWEVWPVNVDPWQKDRNKLKFGRKLQRRWRDEGILLLDVIQSQPIPLDLKTLAQASHK
jgi:hypothetical protein